MTSKYPLQSMTKRTNIISKSVLSACGIVLAERWSIPTYPETDVFGEEGRIKYGADSGSRENIRTQT